MRGAVNATKTQKRSMLTPIVALLERSISDISLRSRPPSDDEGRPPPDESRGEAGCGVASGTESEMSPILFQLSISQTEDGD